MEKMRERQDVSIIDCTDQLRTHPITSEQLSEGTLSFQVPTAPRFENYALSLSAGGMRSPIEMPSLPTTPSSITLQADSASLSLQDSLPKSHPVSLRKVSLHKLSMSSILHKVPETPVPSSSVSSTLFLEIPETQDYPRISVIIPTRNEAANLPYVLPHIPSIVNEVILVDGHSRDATVEVARQLLPAIRIVEQQGRGKGNAISAGLEVATGDIIVLLDADGSADPQEIPTFVEALLAGNDFAKGSRFARGGGSHDITMLRRIGNHGLSGLVNILFGTHFSDLCYGYNAFWKHCLNYVAIDSDGFEVETLINIRMHQAGLKIFEVPSFEYPRIHGTSNLNTFRDGWRVLQTIFRERRRRPLVAPKFLLNGN